MAAPEEVLDERQLQILSRYAKFKGLPGRKSAVRKIVDLMGVWLDKNVPEQTAPPPDDYDGPEY